MKKIFLLLLLTIFLGAAYFSRIDFYMGNYYFKGGNDEKALNYYEDYISNAESGQDLSIAKKNLSVIYKRLARQALVNGDYVRTIELYKRMIKMDFSKSLTEYAVLKIGNIYDTKGWLDRSEKLYRKYYYELFTSRLKARLLYIYLKKADDFLRKGFFVDAKKYYGLAVKIAPKNVQALTGINIIRNRGLRISDLLNVFFVDPSRLGVWEATELFNFFYKNGELRFAGKVVPQLPHSIQNIDLLRSEETVFSKFSNESLVDIVSAIKENSILWLATRNQGIFKYNEKTGKVRFFNFSDQLNRAISIRGLDRYLDFLFVATLRDGLIVFDPVVGQLAKAKLSSRNITTILRDGGSLYIGTLNGAILKYDISNDSIVKTYKMPRHYKNPILSIVYNAGEFYIGTFKGFFIMKNGSIKRHLLNGIPVKSIADYNGSVFIGTWGDGVYKYENGVLRKVNSRVRFINKVKKIGGFLYICTNGDGLWRYTGKYNYWYKFDMADGLPGKYINNVFFDGAHLWVFGIDGTSKSLVNFSLNK